MLVRFRYDKKIRMEWIIQLFSFIFIFFSIGYAYPEFFPDYAKGALTVKIEGLRVAFGAIGIVAEWFFLRKEYAIYKEKNLISAVICIFINYLYFLPGIFMAMFYDRSFTFLCIYIMYVFAFNVLVIALSRTRTKAAKQLFNKRDTQTICIVATGIMTISALFMSGFQINIFNVFNQSEVYAARAANDMTSKYYILWYFIIFGASIIPTWLMIALRNKQYFFAVFYTFAVFAMYSVSCNRQFLFTLAFAYLIYFRKNDKNLISTIFICMWGLVVVEWLLGQGWLYSDILRRLAIVPNIDTNFHVDYFLDHEPDYLRQAWNMYFNRLGIISPYRDRIATLIGWEYFGTTINANTGLLGGNFANYGYASIVIGPILYSLSFAILDRFFANIRHQEIALATAVVIAFSVGNSENWIELLITPSWLLFYYISLLFLPKVRGRQLLQ